MYSRILSEFSDAELAAMIRSSIYARHTRFGDGEFDSRFLIVLAVPYGKDEDVTDLPAAIEAFRRLLTDDDYRERFFQVYDHAASQRYFSVTMEELESPDLDIP